MIQGRIRRQLPLGTIAIGALFLAVSAQVAWSCPEKSEQVGVTVSDDKITSPKADSKVTIYQNESEGNSKVCWVITGLNEGYTLDFVTKTEEASSASVEFDKGKTVRGKRSGSDKRVGIPDKVGSWHYKIVLQKGDADIDTLDPEVQVLGKGGGGVQ